MLGEKQAKQIVEQVMAHSEAAQTEVVLLGTDNSLTRFANSRIHQNMAEHNVQVRVRAVSGRRAGVTSTNDLSDRSLQETARQALQMARLEPENPDFQSLPTPRQLPNVNAFAEATAAFTPQERAEAVSVICRLAEESGLVASGAFATECVEMAVANSLGVFAYSPATVSELTTVIVSEDSSGYANAIAMDVHELEPEQVGREAIEKALLSRNPRAVEAGEFTVILEEYAVAGLLDYLSYLGFIALAVQEGRSFMAGRLGERIAGTNISIWDDGLDSTGLPMRFDFEGVPKTRVDLITNGVAKAVVYDSYTAAREGRESTGHALPAPNTNGPLPGNLFLKPGVSTREAMLASVDQGLWVTRFHYVNPVHPLKTILTGMTRDGTFWIEKGQIAWATKNLRFTQSALEALNRVSLIGQQTKLTRGFLRGTRVPALRVDGFAFTGVTQF